MIIFTLLIFILVINASQSAKRVLNVGTVLFSEHDCNRECWSTEDMALLTSRMLLEDLLPSKEVLVIKENAFVTDLVDYFRLVLEVVRKLTRGKAKHIMLLALTDMLGGYLHRYVIPTARHAYYAGYLNFESMESLLQLFEELKSFLRTNGHGWAKPLTTFGKKMPAQPLTLPPPAPNSDACKGLIYLENNDDSNIIKNTLIIPMPFFDSKTDPSAIAVPFKVYSLRNIESKAASYVLVKFYTASVKCLASHSSNKSNISEFNNEVYCWIFSQVLPLLPNDKFYSAFGGVLRLYETLKQKGAYITNKKKMGNYNIMPEMEVKGQSVQEFEKGVVQQKRKKSDLILLALLATIFVWFLLGSLFICYRIRASKGRPGEAAQYHKGTTMQPSNKSSKKGSSTQTSKNQKSIMTSSGKISPSDTSDSEARLSPGSKLTWSSGRSRKSPKSNAVIQCKAPCSYGMKSQGSEESPCSICSRRRSQSATTKSTPSDTKNPTLNPSIRDGSIDLRKTASLEHVSLQNNQHVFGYEVESSSSSESTPKEQSDEENEDYEAGNMSK